jgi:DNA modification methylase
VTPYYEDDHCTIYHGDCREILPALTFDVIVTDPPYGTGYYATDCAVDPIALLAQYDLAALQGVTRELG